MTIELIELLACPATVFLAVALTAKLIERQRDVLYGPYIQGRATAFDAFREELDEYLAAVGLKREYGRLTVKFASLSIFASAIIG
jgi:hypothetical protein